MKTDGQLQAGVLDELRHDRHVQACDIGVQVIEGIVTLTGMVLSHAKNVAAREAAHRVAGVLDVANEIEVRPPCGGIPTDVEVARAVRRALAGDRLVPAHAIHATVSRGRVTLHGRVPRGENIVEAERAVRGAPSVVDVINRLTVGADLPATVLVLARAR